MAARCSRAQETSMTFKRKALSALTWTELLEVGRELDLGVTTNMPLDEMMDMVAGSKKRGILERVLDLLARDTLKAICFAVGISAEGREKQVLIDKRVVVQLRDATDPETGGSYTLKRWHVASVGKDGGSRDIELRSDNPDFAPIRMRREDGEIRVIAEFLEVVG
jgi:hypothetical protein